METPEYYEALAMSKKEDFRLRPVYATLAVAAAIAAPKETRTHWNPARAKRDQDPYTITRMYGGEDK